MFIFLVLFISIIHAINLNNIINIINIIDIISVFINIINIINIIDIINKKYIVVLINPPQKLGGFQNITECLLDHPQRRSKAPCQHTSAGGRPEPLRILVDPFSSARFRV